MKHWNFRPVSRRTFLRGAGVSLALPLLDSMLPRAMGQSARTRRPGGMICICTALGMHAPVLLPQGRRPRLQAVAVPRTTEGPPQRLHRLQRPRQLGNEAAGHNSEMTFLTGARDPQLPGFRNSISIDQFVADKFDVATRFPSLILAINGQRHFRQSQRRQAAGRGEAVEESSPSSSSTARPRR